MIMKTTLYLAAVLLPCLVVTSCKKDEFEPHIDPSSTVIEMEGEGGQSTVAFSNGDWEIEKIINLTGHIISGNSYAVDGAPVRENKPLTLTGLGKLKASWPHKGFSIIRTRPTSLEVVVDENSTGEAFGFIIVLSDGEESREITVSQNKSQGYSFESIEYLLKEGDGDSLYTRSGTTYRLNVLSPREFTFLPVSGVDMHKTSYFRSTENDAFVWLKDDAISVRLPVHLQDGDITLGEKGIYTDAIVAREHDFTDLRETVVVPEGTSEFSTEVEFRKRKVSYVLHLRNNRTDEPKTIEGKWIETTPTGAYSIKWH